MSKSSISLLNDLRSVRKSPLVLTLFAVVSWLVLTVSESEAATIVWSSSGGSAWLTNTNWTGNAVPGTTDIAEFDNNPSSGGQASGVGVNYSNAVNNGTFSGAAGSLPDEAVGAIIVTASRTNTLFIGNTKSTNSGYMTLNGATVNSQAGTILSNASSKTLTIQNNVQSSSGTTFGLVLGGTSSYVQTAAGSLIVITSTIDQANSGSAITLLGGGSGSTTGGTLELGGSNSFTGGITIGDVGGTANAGVVQFDTTTSMPTSGNVTVNTNSQFNLNTAGTFGGSSQTVTINGVGTVANSGAIRTASNAAVVWSGGVALASNSTITTAGATGSLQINGNVSGAFQLNKAGQGNLIFAGANSAYSGSTWLTNGTITVNSGSNLGSGALKMGDDSGTNNVTLTLNNSSQSIGSLSEGSASVTRTLNLGTNTALTIVQTTAGSYSGLIAGSTGSLVLGAGSNSILTLATGNTYGGKTTINGGFIAGSGETVFGANPGSFTANQITLNGGGIQASGDITFSSNRGITLGAGGGTFDTNGNTITLTNVVTGSGGITKAGTGSLVLDGSHTYTGGLTINAGVVKLTNAGGLNSTTPNSVIFGAAVASGTKLQLNDNSVTVSGLSTNATPGSAVVESGSGSAGTDTLTVNNSAGNTYAGLLQDGSTRSLALTKQGAGTLALTGANSYSGSTNVNGGTLQVGVSGSGKTGTGTTTLNGATAVLAGTGTVQGSGSVILGSIKPGDNGGDSTGTLNMQSLTFTPVSSTTVAELQITGSTAGGSLAFDKIHITGNLTLNSFSNILVNGTGYTAAVGDSFTILDWSGVVTTNGFSTGTNLRTGASSAGNQGNLNLPDITGIGFWQISNMANNGTLTLTVVSVPEPTRGMLLLISCLVLLWRRRW